MLSPFVCVYMGLCTGVIVFMLLGILFSQIKCIQYCTVSNIRDLYINIYIPPHVYLQLFVNRIIFMKNLYIFSLHYTDTETCIVNTYKIYISILLTEAL